MHKARDITTLGFVLRRTNYGEFDRILNIITPLGKFAVIAKSARKEKSKLAGGIEMFSRTQFGLHFGKGELGIVTSAKMQKFYSGIVRDLARMELASEILRKISRVAENSDAPEYFEMVDQALMALDAGENLGLVEAWFVVRLKKISGEELNFYRDSKGAKLAESKTYHWDMYEKVMVQDPQGDIGANQIKLLRLMAVSDLNTVRRIKTNEAMLAPVLRLAQEVV